MGTGLAKGIFWKDISVENDTYGKPYIKLYREANTRLKKLSSNSCRIDVSLRDEKDYAIANVVISQSIKWNL